MCGGGGERTKQASKNRTFPQASVKNVGVILILGRGHKGIPVMCVLPHNVSYHKGEEGEEEGRGRK